MKQQHNGFGIWNRRRFIQVIGGAAAVTAAPSIPGQSACGAAGAPSVKDLPELPSGAVLTRTGVFICVRHAHPWRIAWKLRDYQAWSYGVNDSATFHLEHFPTPYEPAREAVSSFPMIAPYAWLVRWSAKAHHGLWIRPDRRSQVAHQGDQVVVEVPAGAEVAFASVNAIEEGYSLADKVVSVLEPIRWQGLTGQWRDLVVKVTDHSGSGRPNMVHSRWDIYRGRLRKMVFRFLRKDQDPLHEGAFCLISLDLNKDGHVDDHEVDHPVYKLVDINGDGQFFAGFILQGGRLEQDAYYYNLEPAGQFGAVPHHHISQRLERSPGGLLWTNRVTAYDLDGDGRQEVTERLAGLAWDGRGEGGQEGTAANRSGLMINYARRPFSEVLEINAAAGTIAQHFIQYDQYFFAGNAASTAASYIDANHVWHASEEHMQYAKFHPRYGEAHLWTWQGGLHRVILGELGGTGKYKLGVAFSPAIDAMLPDRIAVWKTPWGQELKLMSYIAPEHWDGKKLEYSQRPGGHLDYSHPSPSPSPSPWTWALSKTISSTATIEPNDVPGQQAFEAYLGGTCARSRNEYSPAGKTTCVFYYSPLLGGLHSKGALYGHTNDHRLLYYDTDADGVMDAYAWDVDKDNRYNRRLWYERKTGQVTLYDHGKFFQWHLAAEFPQSSMALEDYGRLDRLYRMGDGDKALAMQPLPVRARPAHLPVVTVALDEYQGAARLDTWSSQRSEGGMAFLARALAFSRANLTVLKRPFTAESLRSVHILILSYLGKPLNSREIQILRGWTHGGGTLILAPAGLNTSVPGQIAFAPDQLAGFKFLAAQFKGDFVSPVLDVDFRKLRIPWETNIAVNIIGNKYPSELNRIEHFSGKSAWLRDLHYLAVQGYTVKAPETLLAWEDQPIVGRAATGRGQVLFTGGSLLCNRFCMPPVNHYELGGAGGGQVDNFILAQRIVGECVGMVALPYPKLQHSPIRPVKHPVIPWQHAIMESDVMKLIIYPQLGGRLLWLGRRDSSINQLRMEEPFYLAGPPDNVGNPFTYGRNYGGLWDVDDPDWPGLLFFDKTYQVQQQNMPQASQMVASAQADGVSIRREMLLPTQQTAALFHVTQTNVSAFPRRMMILLHGEFTAGPDGVDIYWPEGKKIHHFAYILGREQGRGFKPFNGTWAAAVDKTHHELILHRIEPESGTRLFYWGGSVPWENDSFNIKQIPSNYYGFYSLQFWFPAGIIQPGASMGRSVRMEILAGMDGVDIVGINYAAEIHLSQLVLKAGDELIVQPRLATVGTTPLYAARLTILGPPGFARRTREFEPKPAPAPGRARQWTWQLSTDGWPDGTYEILMEGPDHQHGRCQIKVESAKFQTAEKQYGQAEQLLHRTGPGMARQMTAALVAEARSRLRSQEFEEIDPDSWRWRQLMDRIHKLTQGDSGH